MAEAVYVHIAPASDDEGGEGLWATPIDAQAGIYRVENFPISEVDYTNGDAVQVADDGTGRLYIVGLAERRFQPALIEYGTLDRPARRALRLYFEGFGARLEWLVAGTAGVAVPVDITRAEFGRICAEAPSPVRWPDEDA